MVTDLPERKTASGVVSGVRQDSAWAFLGIPYAAPPVGEARFQEPRPVVPWPGVRRATRFGPAVPQVTQTWLAAPVSESSGTEWLSLNVWIPVEPRTERRPVMVWIHGGAFQMGTAAEPDYNGRHLAGDGDVVVVTVNYRLGMEGFGQLAGAPPNRALLDVVAALKWVRENIGEFGGDPDRVTVFGQSAGALMVAALLAMPAAKDLFRRAIVQSTPATMLSPELAEDVAGFLLGSLGLPTTAAELAASDPWELATSIAPLLPTMLAQYQRWGGFAVAGMPFAPVVDGTVLPRTPWDALADGAARDIELLVGHTRDESGLYLALSGLRESLSPEQLTFVIRMLAPAPDGFDAYRNAFPAASDAELLEIVQSDATFRMPAIRLAEAQVAGGGRAFGYELTWEAPGRGGTLGACHCLDYGLVFGIKTEGLTAILTDGATPDGLADHDTLAREVRKRWAEFARTGDPGWVEYDSVRRLVQVIDLDWNVVRYPEEQSRRIWSDYVPRVLPLLAAST